MKKEPGYIIILALMLISVGTLLVSSVAPRIMAYRQFARYTADREQAKMLALSGIEIACGSLITPLTKEAKGSELIARIVALTTTWHTYPFTEQRDGFEGSCKLYIAHESGKIPLNDLYNFTEKKFPGKKLLIALEEPIKKYLGIRNFAEVFEEIAKKREKPFTDLSEISSAPEYQKALKKPEEKHEGLSFEDLFTLHSGTKGIYPLSISRTLAHLLGLSEERSTKKRTDKKFLETITTLPLDGVQWASRWNSSLVEFYNKQYTDIPDEIRAILSPKFETTFFSVICYGKFGLATQKVRAILERETGNQNGSSYHIKKLYWL